MYGGLFGDLPAAKSDPTSSSTQANNNVGTPSSTPPTAAAAASACATFVEGAKNTTPAANATGKSTALAPPAMRPRFILPVKRPRTTPQPQPQSKPTVETVVAVVTTTPDDDAEAAAVTTAEMDSTRRTSASNANPLSVLSSDVLWHAERSNNNNNPGEERIEPPPKRDAQTKESPELQPHLYAMDMCSNNTSSKDDAKNDWYDPFVPNDLLQYWDRQSAALEREKLVLLQHQRMQEQHDLRQRVQEERSRLHNNKDEQQQQYQSNNSATEQQQQRQQDAQIQKLLEPRGRGRGGLSNLPAWLVERQKQQKAEEPKE